MKRKLLTLSAAVLCLAGLFVWLDARLARSSVSSPAASDVATLSGVANDGETIPLPTFSDGTPATEAECSWTVSVNQLSQSLSGGPHSIHCSAEGRLISVFWCTNEDCLAGRVAGAANYMIIAVRGSNLPTNARASTWGAAKARYR